MKKLKFIKPIEGMKKIKLTKPIEGEDGLMTEIELREPLVQDIRIIGSPFMINSAGRPTSDDARVVAYIARLGNIPPIFLEKMCATDYLEIMGVVMSFFSLSEEGEVTSLPPSSES